MLCVDLALFPIAAPHSKGRWVGGMATSAMLLCRERDSKRIEDIRGVQGFQKCRAVQSQLFKSFFRPLKVPCKSADGTGTCLTSSPLCTRPRIWSVKRCARQLEKWESVESVSLNVVEESSHGSASIGLTLRGQHLCRRWEPPAQT